MSEVQPFVQITEDFWKKESLKLTIQGKILDENIKREVEQRIASINQKLDSAYKSSIIDFNGQKSISSSEKAQLVAQLQQVVNGFNKEISSLKETYIWRTAENKDKIVWTLQQYFSDKQLVLKEWMTLASAIWGYARGEWEAVNPKNTLPLN